VMFALSEFTGGGIHGVNRVVEILCLKSMRSAS